MRGTNHTHQRREFANILCHPKYNKKKRYLVITDGYAENGKIDKLKEMKTDGEEIRPVAVKVVGEAITPLLMFTLTEGKTAR